MQNMPLYPKTLFRADVEDYLRRIFTNKELVAAVGALEAEKRFDDLLLHLSRPPACTTVRVNTLLASIEHVTQLLKNEIAKQFPNLGVPVLQHPRIPDVLLVPVIGPRKTLEEKPLEVIVGAQCGNAVLRGAHVFVPGIKSASKWMKAGNVVSVYSDIEGKCKRGAVEFSGNKIFIGNGISEISRKDIFNSSIPLK